MLSKWRAAARREAFQNLDHSQRCWSLENFFLAQISREPSGRELLSLVQSSNFEIQSFYEMQLKDTEPLKTN